MSFLLQFPALPTNAPTSGPSAIIFWGLFGFAILLFAALKLFPSGSQRLAYRQKGETDALTIQQGRIDEMMGVQHMQRLELKRLSLNEESDREYRHALANQNQALMALCEVQHTVLLELLNSSTGVPDYLKRRVAELKTPSEILANIPLPRPRVWTLGEVELLDRVGGPTARTL